MFTLLFALISFLFSSYSVHLSFIFLTRCDLRATHGTCCINNRNMRSCLKYRSKTFFDDWCKNCITYGNICLLRVNTPDDFSYGFHMLVQPDKSHLKWFFRYSRRLRLEFGVQAPELITPIRYTNWGVTSKHPIKAYKWMVWFIHQGQNSMVKIACQTGRLCLVNDVRHVIVSDAMQLELLSELFCNLPSIHTYIHAFMHTYIHKYIHA